MRKSRMVMRNGPEGIFAANKRGTSKLISHDHAKCSRKAKIVAVAFRTIMRNCWISCEMTILLLNSRFLSEEASGRPLR